jgi:restriction system protein
MTSQIFSFDTQPARYTFSNPRRAKHSNSRGYASGWLILAAMTALFSVWLLVRWLVQPSWPESLPNILAELLSLIEVALALTLIILWAGLLWRRRSRAASATSLALSVDQMYALSPKAFEHYVAGLFRLKGYRAAVRGRSGDHGVDLELTAPNGRRAIVQCKRYRDTVGEEIVRGLFGTLLHETAHHAFLVTTADISDSARNWAAGKPLTLVDGPTLVEIALSLSVRRDR